MSKAENNSNYMDGIKVKISEKYKPPPRINLATTYSQRISLNKQLQDNLPIYDFSLEATIKEKMKEWRTARNLIAIDRKEKLDKIKEERRKRVDEEILKKKEMELNQINDINLETKQNYTSGGVLIPTQVSGNNYTSILTPIPLSAQTNSCMSNEKSPINISDFEPDTCSPFDNVELNTINDLEELKLVLQNERTNVTLTQTNYPVANNLQTYPPSGMKFYNYQTPHGSSQSYPVTSVYSNGFNYYTPEVSSYNNTYNYNTSYSSKTDVSTNVSSSVVDDNKPFKNVPDIMRALQNELSNMRITNINLATEGNASSVSANSDGLENPFEQLSMGLQDVCKRISSMGFPLARVARACKNLGDDDKKIIEHLLAMSQLLDLGFTEKKVSSALLQCDNDRDKALELLIS